MKAEQIYTQAERNGIHLQATCASVSLPEWDAMMKGTTKANGRRIRKIIQKHLPEIYDELGLEFFNPYEKQAAKKPGLLVYVHSGIEYFFTIN